MPAVALRRGHRGRGPGMSGPLRMRRGPHRPGHACARRVAMAPPSRDSCSRRAAATCMSWVPTACWSRSSAPTRAPSSRVAAQRCRRSCRERGRVPRRPATGRPTTATSAGNRHSTLPQITPANVRGLRLAWTFAVPGARYLRTTPLVVGGVMYVTAPNEVFALDAHTWPPDLAFRQPRTPGVIGDAGAGVNRGVALKGDRLFVVTDDARIVALHRGNGQVLWDTRMADFRQHYGATSAPLVVGDLVITGVSGGDEGARGFVAAYEVATGARSGGSGRCRRVANRARRRGRARPSIIRAPPVADRLLRRRARQLLWTTGNPCPDYNGDERRGDNLWSNSVVALDPTDRPPALVLPVHAARPQRLGRRADRHCRRCPVRGQASHVCSSRPIATASSTCWIARRASPCAPTPFSPNLELGDRRRRQRPSAADRRHGAVGARHDRLPVGGRRHQLDVAGVQPGDGPVLRAGARALQRLPEVVARVRAGRVVLRRQHAPGPGETGGKVLRALDISTGRIAWELPQVGQGDSWAGVLSTRVGSRLHRRRRWDIHRAGRARWPSPLAVRRQRRLARVADDLPRAGAPARGDRRRRGDLRVRAGGTVSARVRRRTLNAARGAPELRKAEGPWTKAELAA